MVDVFISYSREDEAKVSQLADAIAAEGYDVWWDADLPPHMSYGDVITAKIGAAKAAVVVWSATAAASEWVRAEADVARSQKKLIQTSLDNVMPPLPFNQIQCAEIGDWRGEADHRGWRKVKESLAALCGPRGAQDTGGLASSDAPMAAFSAPTAPPPGPAPVQAPVQAPTPAASPASGGARAARRREGSAAQGATTGAATPQWSEAQRRSAAMANPAGASVGTGSGAGSGAGSGRGSSSDSSGALKAVGIGCAVLFGLAVLAVVVLLMVPVEEDVPIDPAYSPEYVDPTYEDEYYVPPPAPPAPPPPVDDTAPNNMPGF